MSSTDASLASEVVGAAALPVAKSMSADVRAQGPLAVAQPLGSKRSFGAGEAPLTRDPLPPLAGLRDLLHDAPAWLISAALHILALIVLGLLFFAAPGSTGIQLSMLASDESGEDLEPGDLEIPLDFEMPETSDTSAESLVPEIAETESFVTETLPAIMPLEAPSEAIQMGLSGREAGMKASLLAAYGGTGATEDAVAAGLEWLARNQGNNGLWNLNGKYPDGVNSNNPEAATALALLAFQGAGHTPMGDAKDPHTRIVKRAWYKLLESQDEEGNFFKTGRNHGRLYTQAICTIALCELYGMTHDEQYRIPAQMAIDYCVSAQGPEGGWRYYKGEGSDLSVTGWFVMALQSARMAGLNVPSETLSRISDFLDTVSTDGGSQYVYMPTHGKRMSMTAEGLLCRQYLGWKHDNPKLERGANLLIKNLPKAGNNRDSYYWYYASQVCHHMEGKHWQTWNNRMRTVVPALQVKTGRQRGSWDPKGDNGETHGGRLYVTCLSLYMLEVYYRHLPIYKMELLSGH